MIILNVRFVGMSNPGLGVVEGRVWGRALVGKMMATMRLAKKKEKKNPAH